MNETLKKVIVITSVILISLFALLLALYAFMWAYRASVYSECLRDRKYVCNIPGLNNNFVPQGIGYSSENDLYVMTGYNGKHTTMMYVVKNNKAKQVKLAGENNNELEGHGGGCTVIKNYVYVTGNNSLHVYNLTDLINVNDNMVSPLKTLNIACGAAFCFTDESNLYVGEFYRKGNYETDLSHYYLTPNGEQNKAIICCYPLNKDGLIAQLNVTDGIYPEYAISILGLVQGFAKTGDTYILSRSYALTNSTIEYYNAPLNSGENVTLSIKNNPNQESKNVPLLYLDSTLKYKTLTLPSFSEDLTIVNNRVVVTNEAACNKYFIGKLFGAHKVYSFPIYDNN